MGIHLTTEQEIEALKYAREELVSCFARTPYICVHLSEWIRAEFPKYKYAGHEFLRRLSIFAEIEEFLDDAITVDTWLKASRTISLQFRVAIIDTLLARRGVFL